MQRVHLKEEAWQIEGNVSSLAIFRKVSARVFRIVFKRNGQSARIPSERRSARVAYISLREIKKKRERERGRWDTHMRGGDEEMIYADISYTRDV